MLGPENLFVRRCWLRRSRLWRLVLLMNPAGYWDPSPSLALPLLAQRVVAPRKGAAAAGPKLERGGGLRAWRAALTLLATEGEREAAAESVQGEDPTALALCPLTGLDPSAVEWSVPQRLRDVAALYEDGDRPLPVARVWATVLATAQLRRLDQCWLLRTEERDGFEETVLDRGMFWLAQMVRKRARERVLG